MTAFCSHGAISAASRNGSQASQIRPLKFESQDESSCWVLHKLHLAKVFLSNGLIAKLILMFVVLGTDSKPLVSSGLLDRNVCADGPPACILVGANRTQFRRPGSAE
jgi:hypothetical protein